MENDKSETIKKCSVITCGSLGQGGGERIWVMTQIPIVSNKREKDRGRGKERWRRLLKVAISYEFSDNRNNKSSTETSM